MHIAVARALPVCRAMKLYAGLAMLVAVAGTAAAEDGLRFELKRQPSLRAGDWLRIDFRAKIQNDFNAFSPAQEDDARVFDPRRLRAGVEGRLTRDVEFEFEYELLPSDHPVRDAFVNYRRFRDAQVKAGYFKIPFSLDQLTGPNNMDFISRSRIGNQLAPGREKGLMVHGKMFEQGFGYQAGVFAHDGEISEAADNFDSAGTTVAGRLTVAPLVFAPSPAVLKKLQFGFAATRADVAEGLYGLRGRTVARETFFDRIYVNGARTRRGAEWHWPVASFVLQGEYIDVRQQRRGQSLSRRDLPDLVARGWYASATRPVLGSRPGNTKGFALTWLPGAQFGLIEAAIRYEQIRFGARESASSPSRSPRAANVLPASDRVLTMGINWYSNRYTKFQFNAIRERLEDPLRVPVTGVQRYWIFAGRVQFVM
jgi:phosphate-selective porin